MDILIRAALDRSRATLLILLFLFVAGTTAYIAIPKESDPDVAIPIIYVSMNHDGISPVDAERLLVRPMENELKGIEGIKEMRSEAGEGHASVTLEFDAGFNSKKALDDVREKVDTAKTKLPGETDDPEVHEVNVALFPVLSIALAGSTPERTLLKLAKQLKEDIEALPGVLEVVIGGDREELMEVLVNPLSLESYQIDFASVVDTVSRNNRLVAVGAMESDHGRMVLKAPGVIEDVADLLALPLKVEGDAVVTFGDVATVRRTYKDPEGFARVDGENALVLEVKKRVGANIIQTIEAAQQVVDEHRSRWPDGVQHTYILDQSNKIRDMLKDLMNNVLSAIILVMVIILAAMGMRSSALVGVVIPGSFVTGIFIIYQMGMTLNIVVLFSLILVVGMLVDGAIVVAELADRNIQGGQSPRDAFFNAAKRMSWPVIASTATTLVVFLPLLFWPGIIGQFMKYLPLTVVICLTAALFMALIFLPVLGSVFSSKKPKIFLQQDERSNRITHGYGLFLAVLLRHPGKTLMVALITVIGSSMAYGKWGMGVEFFPDVEPESAMVQIQARGDLSIHEKDAILRQVEQRIIGWKELESVYARSFNRADSQMAADVIGVIQFQLVDWDKRRKAKDILAEMRKRTADIPGVVLAFRKAEQGPSGGKPIQLQVNALDNDQLFKTVALIRTTMDELGGFIDGEDNRPLPGIEWRLQVDRAEAARFGADVTLIGKAVQLITAGIKVATVRPDSADDEVDVRIRFPAEMRSLDQLLNLQIRTHQGMVALSSFVSLEPAHKTGTLKRVNTKRTITIQADVQEGRLVDERQNALQKALEELNLPPTTKLVFKGEEEQQAETGAFLGRAFATALFLMTLILVIQFNSLYQAFLVLTAVAFSTAGVLLGLLVTQQPFGVVMVGLGIIALAGIVVNNNIVLIDTYNEMRGSGLSPRQAAHQTGQLRLRPVLLTAITTVVGLMPMVLAMNIDLINRSITFGSPSTQWWTQLSTAIAGGLTFATLLTLFVTPALLVMGELWPRKNRMRTHKLKRAIGSLFAR
ncbi:MAG: efflux RND transporter permease subunit [Magnetococcales bacterium]|nr:efflux RND transporter permease subunit [Magnetococcales bacterium]